MADRTEYSLHSAISGLMLYGRKCHTYTPVKEKQRGHGGVGTKTDEFCYCGERKDAHTIIPNGKSLWNIDKNTIIKPITDKDYGPKDLTKNEPKYIRCDINTPADKLQALLLDVWKIKPPQLLLGVIGGAKYFKMDDRLENFCNTIIDATRQSNAWLLTSGFNIGIVQMVGQALAKVRFTNPREDITAIAVTKFGCIKGGSSMIQSIEQTSVTTYDRSKRKGQHGLEPHHTHYILLDDGTRRRYDGIQDRLAVLMHTVSNGKSSQTMPGTGICADYCSVPAVTLVVEGGHDTIMGIYHSLSCEIPVVIVKGSGRVADFFVSWLSKLKDVWNGDKEEKRKLCPKGVREFYQTGKTATISFPSSFGQNINKRATTIDNNNRYVQTASFHMNCNKRELENIFEPFKDDMRKHLKRILSHQREESWQMDNEDRLNRRITDVLPFVMYCLQPAVQSAISCFDPSDDDDLTDTILRSIYHTRKNLIDKPNAERVTVRDVCKRSPDSASDNEARDTFADDADLKYINNLGQHNKQMLRLALQWNCLEVAKDRIIRGSIEGIESIELEHVVLTTLKENLPAFLHYLITLGIPLSCLILGFDSDKKSINAELYNNTLMKKLYSHNVIDDIHMKTGSLLYNMIKLDRRLKSKKGQLSTKELNYILKKLIGDIMKEIYPEKNDNNDFDKNAAVVEVDKSSAAKNVITNKIIRDLFFWAVLMNYIDLAKMLLGHMNHRICAALIARKILMSYRNKYVIYSDKKNEYKQSIEYFEDYAIACITKCYKNDQSKACELVLRQCEMFGNVTCLQIAVHAKAKHFVSHPCCVQAISNVWYGMIDIDKMGHLRLGVAILTLGLSTAFAIGFRKIIQTDMFNNQEESPKNSLEPHGITYSDPYQLQRISLFSSEKTVNIHISSIYQFHQSPVAKFLYDCIHYLFLLLLFSYVMLFKFDPPTKNIPSIDWTEILLIILVSCMLIADIRSFFAYDGLTLMGNIRHYISSPLTTIGLLFAYIPFYVGLVLRFVNAESTENFDVARIVMGYTLQFWWLRALKYILVIQFFGPHIVAIRKMLNDLMFFACLIIIVMGGYGTSSRAIMCYGNIKFNAKGIFHDIIYPVYYLMYSQVDSETKYLDTDNASGTSWSVTVHILLAFNMLLIVVLLLNLLIAMFNKRFDKVHEDAKNIWHDQQYRIVHEYYDRTCLLPPFGFFVDIYKLSCMFFNWIQKKRHLQSYFPIKVFKMINTNPSLKESWDEFEGASTYEYAQTEAPIKKKKTKSSDVVTRLEHIFYNNRRAEGTFQSEKMSDGTIFKEFSLAVTKSLDEIKTKLSKLSQSKTGLPIDDVSESNT